MKEKGKVTHIRKGGEKKMAVLTVKCDRAFIVSEEKAKAFQEQKKNEKIFQKIETVTEKFGKNMKVERQ